MSNLAIITQTNYCALGKRLPFDINSTLEESKLLNNEYFDCPNPEPGAPCFYYCHVFYPFFVIEDTAVGESDRFLNSESSQQILVWTYDDIPDSFLLTKDGFILMNGTSNWRTWRGSLASEPVHFREICSVVIVHLEECLSRKRLTGLTDSEYDPVFLMWETASSPFCEHTLRFELHAHGFPLDPVRGLFFMQMTMTVIQTILIYFIGHTCWRLRQKTVYTKKRDGLDEQEGNKQFKAGEVVAKVGSMLCSGFLQLYRITFHIIQNPMLDHFIMLVVPLDTSTLMAQIFQGVTVRTGWCLSAVDSCLLVFYVIEAMFKILVRGRTYFRNPWNDLDFFIVLMSLLDFTVSLVQSAGGFSSRQASTLFRVLKTLKGARVFIALRLLKAIRPGTIFTLFQILMLDDWSLIYMTSRDNGAPHIIYFLSLYILVELFTFLNLFIAVLMDNFQLSIRKKRQCKSQKSPDVNKGETQSSEKAVEDLEMSQAEIEEELHKEALRHASSDSKHHKRKIELISRHLQLLATMDQHMQKYRSQACLLDNLVETFFTDRDEETRSNGVD
ncbi:hypothetical protein AOLI_G00286460 [Acnodon oligacanthus]